MASGESFLYYPRHLGENEISIELEIRGIAGRDEQAILLLESKMQAEFDGLAPRPTAMHSIESVSVEIRNCIQYVRELMKMFAEIKGKPSWRSAEILRSRISHFIYRISRLPQAGGRNVDIENLFKDAEFLVSEEMALNKYLTQTLRTPPPPLLAQSNTSAEKSSQSVVEQSVQSSHVQNSAPADSQPPLSTNLLQPPSNQHHLFAQNFNQPPITSNLPQQQINQHQQTHSTIPIRHQQQPRSQVGFTEPAAQSNSDQSFADYRNAQPYPRRNSSLSTLSWQQQPLPPSSSRSASVGDGHDIQHTRRPAGLSMEKWSIKFSGGSKDLPVEEFIFRVEDMAQSSCVRLDDIISSFHMLLTDRAEEWFWSFRRKQRNATWMQFQTAFKSKFATRQSDAEIMSKMAQRFQQPGEKFDEFCRVVESLSFRLATPIREENLVQLLKSNVDPKLRSVLHLHNFETLDELQEICRQYEDLWIHQGTWCQRRRFVNEIVDAANLQEDHTHKPSNFNLQQSFPAETLPPSLNLQLYQDPNNNHNNKNNSNYHNYVHYMENIPTIEAVQRPATLENAVCWNCDGSGHTYIDCEVATRNVFCYGCGAKNVYRPQCKKCLENYHRRRSHGQPNSAPMFPAKPNPSSATSTWNHRPNETNPQFHQKGPEMNRNLQK